MEAMAAVGLAGNILQFIDFAAKIVTKGHHIYKSVDGSLSENNDLELITSDLVVLQTKLERSPDRSSGAASPNEDDEAVRTLAAASTKLAQQLLTRLNAVKAQGRFRRWKSLRQAVKQVCSKAEVDDMARRLSQFRGELQTRLVVSLRDEVSESHRKLNQQIVTMGNKMVQSFVAQMDHHSRNDNTSVSSQSEQQSLNSGKGSGALGGILNDDHLLQNNESALKAAILSSFEYADMDYRYEAIPDAHAKTFRWILEDKDNEDIPWDNFLQWARSDNSLYWICGKAASGKSTLVKFLLQQEVVNHSLNQWTTCRKLIKADFFFWAMGSPMQRSQKGLLTALLRKILAECEVELVKTLLPDLWHQLEPLSRFNLARLRSGWKPWRLSELISLLENILLSLGKTSRICLFVDGLDEFEGDHAELASTFSRLAKMPNVKLCLSSRPLAAIEYEFAGCSSLKLQDLTRGCIQLYVREKLTAHRHFQTLKQNEPLRIGNLIDRIVTMSSRVFLWVHLVVKSLLEGLTNHDDAGDLEARLMALPPELDALYKTMLQSINPQFYRTQASKLLQVVYSMKGTISSLALSFIDDPESPTPASSCLDPLPVEVVDSRIKRVADRLKSRCKGLIEVQSLGHSQVRPQMIDHPLRPDQVQYLHLTVKEFLEKAENWRLIIDWTAKADFDANTACSRGLLTLARRTFKFHGWGRHIAALIDSALSFARQAEDSSGKPDLALFQDLDDLATAMFPRRRLQHWSSDFTASHVLLCQQSCQCPESSLATHAVFKGLTLYVESMSGASVRLLNSESTEFLLSIATGSSLQVKDMRWFDINGELPLNILLADIASETNSSDYEDRDVRPHSAMIKLLLDKGLSPNESRGHRSPWRELLDHVRDISATKPSCLAKFVDVIRLFILFGADLFCTLPG
ncbi:NACHT domain-containing protein [Cladophialophora immunda]|nr:NACHT domain-containing protein [Cladophialophora immunda]